MKFSKKSVFSLLTFIYAFKALALVDGIIMVGEESREYVRLRTPVQIHSESETLVATTAEVSIESFEDICTAKMINSSFGVTASHCFYDFDEERLKLIKEKPPLIEVVDNFAQEDIVETAKIKRVYYYEKSTSDLAIFELQTPLKTIKKFTAVATFDEMLNIFYAISANQLNLNPEQQQLAKRYMKKLKTVGFGWCPIAKSCPFERTKTYLDKIQLVTKLSKNLSKVERNDIKEMSSYDSLLLTMRSLDKKHKNKSEGYVFYGDSGGPLLAAGFGENQKQYKQIAVNSFGYTADDPEIYEHEGFKVVISELFGPNLCPLLFLNPKDLMPVFPSYEKGCADVEGIDQVQVQSYIFPSES